MRSVEAGQSHTDPVDYPYCDIKSQTAVGRTSGVLPGVSDSGLSDPRPRREQPSEREAGFWDG